MTYVMSDLHGMGNLYFEILEKIKFNSNTDKLYLIGDICDRGPDTSVIFKDIMKRENVFCLLGNHENMLIRYLPKVKGFEYLRELYPDYEDGLLWCYCGGLETIDSLSQLENKEVIEIYKYILQLPHYIELSVGDKEYILVHAGIDNYDSKKSLDEYEIRDFLWNRASFDSLYYDESKTIIVGHTPTYEIREDRFPNIYFGKGNVVDIDCGASYTDRCGRLACLCLETKQEYYVKEERFSFGNFK